MNSLWTLLSRKKHLRTANWTVSWIIQIKGHLFVPPTDISRIMNTGWGRFLPPHVIIFICFHSLPHERRPWSGILTLLARGKKLNRGTIWKTHERGDLNKIGRSHFRLMGHPCYRVFDRDSDICRVTPKVSLIRWKYHCPKFRIHRF